MARKKVSFKLKKRKRRKHKSFLFFKRKLTLADYLLLVLLVSLFCVQIIKWGNQQLVGNEPQVSESVKKQREAFIAQIAPAAQEEQQKYGVLASITLAQAALESDWGKSELSQKYYNLFGIKSGSANEGALMTTKEYVNGQWITVQARFAIYANWDESIAAHTQLFVKGTSWDANHYQDVYTAKDYTSAAQALQDKGYATDPNYAQKLITLIQEYRLNRYD